MAVVYGLIDPRTDELRYIGQTVALKYRLRHHWKPTSLAKQTYVARWLRGLRADGLRPLARVIEETDQPYEAEQRWIVHYRNLGCRLTNLQDKGPGGRPKGWHHSEETRAKIRAARARQPNPRLGTKHTEATRRLFSEQRKGRQLTPEWRAAIARAMTGTKRRPYKPRAATGAQ
jgi:hypothetical protein